LQVALPAYSGVDPQQALDLALRMVAGHYRPSDGAVYPLEPLPTQSENQPVKIAWLPSGLEVFPPSSDLQWGIVRDAPPLSWNTLSVVSAGQRALRAAAIRMVEAWQQIGAHGPQLPPAAKADRRQAGSATLELEPLCFSKPSVDKEQPSSLKKQSYKADEEAQRTSSP
jgi:hypothetical protein